MIPNNGIKGDGKKPPRLMPSSIQPLISPTSRQKYKAKKSCDIIHPGSKG
jgi:hypothetical protein